MDTSRLRQQILQWSKERAVLEESLLGLRGPLVKGWLHQRTTSCQRGQCKCMRGEKHGPFLYASIRVGGRVVQRYAGKKEDKGLVKGIADYGVFRKNRRQLRAVERCLELAWSRLEKGLMKKVV